MRKVVKYNPYYTDDEILYNGKEKSTMSESQLDLIRASAEFELKENPSWRKGQAIFNCAHQMFPYETSFLRGSVHDCFYQDELIDEFLANL